ncbi:restriction endonuclease subunit S [Microcoleus sp. herbarium2]|uniref:restriction endonuclease subunit S n=1 Tax=Microcoleus sp. herbarium2 TaxID=3055433 RepID=UPI002FD57C38
MNRDWSLTSLGKVIKYRKEFIEIDDTQKYKRCRVQCHAKGVVLRDIVQGSEIKTKKQQPCRTGEFLIAEIDAKMGGFGIVPESLDGAIVSSHYFLFEINEQLLDRSFFKFFIRTPFFCEQVAAQGSTNYAAIRPQEVLTYQIPLPPLDEQRRIVARIEELAAKVEEARGLRRQSAEEAEALIKSARRQIIGTIPGANWVHLSKYVKEIENGKSPSCESRPATDNEWGVVKVGCVSFGTFEPLENKALPPTINPDPVCEIQRGDFLMSRANTTQLVGACTIVKKTRSKLLLSDKIFRFVFNKNEPIDINYLDHVLKSPALRLQIEHQATGTSLTMKNISKEKVLRLMIPLHSLPEQRRIVAYLDNLQAKVDALKRLQTETAAELDALLPSILDKGFKGEL